MHTPDSAAAVIVDHIERLPSERIPLRQTLGRVLATDVKSPVTLPHWDNSAMDGYAARSADLGGVPPHELRVVEEIAAGCFPQRQIAEGQCARIFTGAPVPDGADCVIRQEDTTKLGDDRVRIDDTRDVGRNVRLAGEDMQRGAMVLESGSELGPAQLGMLASVAEFDVSVYRRPTVAILGSGNELADAGERDAILAGRKIASSNSYTLDSLVRLAGAEPMSLGVAKDDPADLRRRLLEGRGADLIVTTAGISVGEHDYMHQVLADLQVDKKFWRIRMRPGAPVGFGTIGELDAVPWIGLPGNPVSTMVTFELLVLPAIRKMQGHSRLFRQVTPVTMADEVTLRAPLRHFLRVRLSGDPGALVAHLTGPQGSGLLSSMVQADALAIVHEDKGTVQEGDVVSAIVLSDPRYVEECPW